MWIIKHAHIAYTLLSLYTVKLCSVKCSVQCSDFEGHTSVFTRSLLDDPVVYLCICTPPTELSGILLPTVDGLFPSPYNGSVGRATSKNLTHFSGDQGLRGVFAVETISTAVMMTHGTQSPYSQCSGDGNGGGKRGGTQLCS